MWRTVARYASWGLIICTLGVGTYYVSKRWTLRAAAQAPVHVQPFTLELLEISYASKPGGEIMARRTVARRSDGAEAVLQLFPQHPEAGVGRKLEFPDGSVSSIFQAVGAKMSGFLRADELARKKQWLTNPPSNCARPYETALRVEQVLGHEAWVVQASLSKHRITSWRAREFGCEEIKALIEEVTPAGTYKLLVEVEPLYLAEGEPDPVLFDPSDQYKEMPPSRIRQEFLRRLGYTEQNCPSCCRNHWDSKADLAYQSRQQRP